MLTADIVSLSQEMDLETGSMANFIVLRLSNGKTFRALVNDDAAQQVVQLFVRANGAPDAMSNGVAHHDLEDDLEAHVFGGDEVAAATSPEPSEPAPAPPPDPPPAPRRPLRVTRDEYGYPVVETPGSVDPRSFVGSRDSDEDGVGQI